MQSNSLHATTFVFSAFRLRRSWIFALSFVSISCLCFNDSYAQKRLTRATEIKIAPLDTTHSLAHVHVEWGVRKKQCHGGGLCIIIVDDGPHCPKAKMITPSGNDNPNSSDAWIEVKGKTMTMTFYNPKTKFETLEIDEKLKIQGCTLGVFKSEDVSILPETYKVNYNSCGIGTVELNIE